MIALTVLIGALLTLAPAALAHDNGGQGWYGETTDLQITNVMFIVIAFFPTVIVVFSLIQWRLDRRRHAREDAVKAREASADWRGGW
jgi:heme/copper-type cytochrome/quinol oxidase subunit 2